MNKQQITEKIEALKVEKNRLIENCGDTTINQREIYRAEIRNIEAQIDVLVTDRLNAPDECEYIQGYIEIHCPDGENYDAFLQGIKGMYTTVASDFNNKMVRVYFAEWKPVATSKENTDFRQSMEHLAEIEFMEQYYGLNTHQHEYPTLEQLGIDNEPIEYKGYKWDSELDFNDYEFGWIEYIPRIDWSGIPF